NRGGDKGIEGTIDRSAPVTSASVTPAPGAGGWNRGEVLVSLAAVDSGAAGVEEIHYQLGGGPELTVAGDQATFPVTEEGATIVTFFAVDNAGNREGAKSCEVKIDSRAPETAAMVAPLANAAGGRRP